MINIGGQEELEYGGDVLAALPSLLETSSAELRHDRRGLLTRDRLSRGPEFGVTLGAASELDGSHEVFGRLLQVRWVLPCAQNARQTSQRLMFTWLNLPKFPIIVLPIQSRQGHLAPHPMSFSTHPFSSFHLPLPGRIFVVRFSPFFSSGLFVVVCVPWPPPSTSFCF